MEVVEHELIEALLMEVIASEQIKELICYPRLASQTTDVKTSELADAQGGLDLFVEVFNYPGYFTRDGWFVVDFKVDK